MTWNHSLFSSIIPGNDHEVEFHEIEIQLFQEVELSIMSSERPKSQFLQKPKFRQFRYQQQGYRYRYRKMTHTDTETDR
jgi:hypothetical protein